MRNPFKRRKPEAAGPSGFPIPTICATCGERFKQWVHIEAAIQINPSHVNVICHVDGNVDIEAHRLTHKETA